jgi:hypothetical protein
VENEMEIMQHAVNFLVAEIYKMNEFYSRMMMLEIEFMHKIERQSNNLL